VTPAFRLELPHGRCVGVAIPPEWPLEALAPLLPEEQAAAQLLAPARRSTYLAGRLALRAALADLGVTAGPLLATDRGAPLVPPGARGSISHKRTLAVGLAALGDEGQLGVDLEEIRPARVDIARRVLTDGEQATLPGLAAEARAARVLLHLSLKEAIYKALDPFVRRYVGFQEAALVIRPDGGAEVALALTGGEGPFAVEVSWREISPAGRYFLTTAAIRRA
jgi:enterobactin synthetase component D